MRYKEAKRRGASRRQRGQALVELAIVSSVLLALAIGVADFCRVYYASVSVTNAARAGAQYALRQRYTDTAGIQAAAVADASGLKNFSSSNVTAGTTSGQWFYCQCPGSTGTVTCSATLTCAGGSPQLFVDISTNYTFTTIVNYPGIPHTLTLRGEAIMREQ